MAPDEHDPTAGPVQDTQRDASDVGHYFDQTVFDLQYTLLKAKARRMSLEADLARLGIEVDPQTGEVRLIPPVDDATP